MFIEQVIGKKTNRGKLIELSHFKNVVYEYGQDTSIFRSVFIYADRDEVKKIRGKSVKYYDGLYDIDELPIDIDKGDNSDEYVLSKTRSIVSRLQDNGLDFDVFNVYFSGSGYHIHISRDAFGFVPGKDLPWIAKKTVENMFGGDIDLSIYSRTSLIRAAFSCSEKTGLYKIPLTEEELFMLNWRGIHELAKTRHGSIQSIGCVRPILKHYIPDHVPTVRSLGTVIEPYKVATCIQKLYNDGPREGSRNQTMLRLISHFKRSGIPSEAAKAGLLQWNKNSLDEKKVLEAVENGYGKPYKYGCNDKMMRDKCDTRCIFFKNKDYSVEVKTASQLQEELINRLESDFTGRVINIGSTLGLTDKDSVIFPGEMLTIFGRTGCNKTALAQAIALGYNANSDTIDKDLQIPSLYLSLEVAGWFMHRRNLQIVSDTSKAEATRKAKELFKIYESDLSHIVMQTIPPTMQQIEEKIKEIRPHCVIVDYVELLEPPKGVTNPSDQIRYACQKLRSLAVNYDIVVIMLSQTSRQMSREEVLDLYSAKGSGAIENSSSHVLAINGKNNSPDRTMEMLKASDGELFETKLFWTPSFRLKKVNYLEGELCA